MNPQRIHFDSGGKFPRRLVGAKRFSPGSAPVANHTGLAEPLIRASRSWSNATGFSSSPIYVW